jgi:nucleotide-binding universal stress UspA family protein
MLKSVLVHILDDCGLDGRTAAALDVCRAHDAHLTCMHITPYGAYAEFDPAGGMFVSGVLIEDLRKRQDALQERIEARMAAEDVCWDWQAFDGDVAQTMVSASSLADLVVLGQAGPHKGDAAHPLPIVDGVVVHTGCPVLIVPAGCSRIDPKSLVVIGWNASEQAARAIRQALPTLMMASEVHLVSIGKQEKEFPQPGASEYLSRHGISSELHLIDPGARDPDDVLHWFALDQGAGCLLIVSVR